jgi:hypothetical protein
VTDAEETAYNIARLVEQTLAPLLLVMTSWQPVFRIIVLEAVGRRALALAEEYRAMSS